MATEQELHQGLYEAVVDMDEDRAAELARQVVAEGYDTHDIGKNLVKIMLESAGFEVIDLGRDIKPQAFLQAAKEHEAEIIALSTLMTTAMPAMKEVIDLLEEKQLRENYKVVIGGGPISPGFAKKIKADAYAVNAAEAARIAKELVGLEEKVRQTA